MKNPATHKPKRGEFNAFTQWMFDTIQEGRKPLVRVRDGRIMEVYWFDADGPEYEGFASDTGGCFRWENDGVSITSNDLDIMETV